MNRVASLSLALGFCVVPNFSYAAQLIANGTNQTASGTYDTGVSAGSTGYALWALNNGVISSTSALALITGGSSAYGAAAQSGGSISLFNGSTVNTSGGSAYGLYVNGGSISAVGTGIATTGGGSSGAVVQGSGTLTLTGGSTISTGAGGAYGINAVGTSSALTATVNSTGTIISTAGSSAHGVNAGSFSNVTLQSGSVATTNSQANGLFAFGASGQAKIQATGVAVSTAGTDSHGAEANLGGNIGLSSGSVTTSGQNGYGLYTIGTGATLTAKDTLVSTSGNGANGAYALQGQMALTNVLIATTGASASGAVVDNASTLSITGGTVTTSNSGSFGVLSLAGSTLTANNVAITTNGGSSPGAASEFGALVSLAGGSVTTNGNGSNGLFSVGLSGATGASLIADGVAVTTNGTNSHGAVVRGGSSITLSGGTIVDAKGVGSSALFSSAFDTAPSTVTVQNSTLTSQQSTGVYVTGTTLNATLTNSSLSGVTLLEVVNNGANSGVLNLNALSSSKLSGNAVTQAGSTSNLTLRSNSLWTMTGNSNVTSLVNDASFINYTAPAGDPTQMASYKTLTTRNYVGQGGTIALNTFLAGDGAPSDLLVIDGGTATGLTTLVVRNTTGPGALTLVDGIKVVDAINGATTADGSFVLRGTYVTADGQQAVVGGAYAYTLFHNGVSDPSDSDWYLRSQFVPTPPGPTPPNPPEPPQPRFQPGVPLYEVYPQHLLALNGVPTLQQRVGNRYWSEPAQAAPQDAASAKGGANIENQAIWGRIEGAHNHVEPAFTTSGTDYDTNVWKLQAGLDGLLHEVEDGSKLIGGITVHFGQASSDVTSFFGDGDINTNGYGFGGTLTWYDQNGFYVDGQAQLTWFNSDLTSKALGLETPTLVDGNGGFGYALSLETGKKIDLNETWTLTPQAQLVYSNVHFSRFTDVFGADVALDGGDSLLGRLGLSADHDQNWKDDDGKTRRRHLYGIANLYYEFLDATKVNVSGVSFETRPDKLWGGVGLGGSYNWNDDKYSVYGEVSVNSSLENFADSYALAGTAGFRVKW